MKLHETPIYLTRKEAAEILKLEEQSLANLAWKGQGPTFVRLSARCVRYNLQDLLAWAKVHEVRHEAE
jgi:hypothetical protein